MTVPDQAPEIRMPLRDETEHIPDFPLIPVGRMNFGRDGLKEPFIPMEIRRDNEPVLVFPQRKQVPELVAHFSRSVIDSPQ
jgi:hypothetical protein